MKNFFKPAVVLLAAVLVTSCKIEVNGIKGSGNIISETRNISGFTKVSADSGLEVEILQSENFEVVVEADDNVLHHIRTTVKEGTLDISTDANSFMNTTRKVTVKMPVVKEIDADSGCTISSVGTLRSDNLSVEADSGSTVRLQVESDKVVVDCSGGARADLSGMALSLNAEASGGATVSASKLIANDVLADASGGGRVEVNAAVKLHAEASGGGTVRYQGNAQKVTIEESSGGSISKQ